MKPRGMRSPSSHSFGHFKNPYNTDYSSPSVSDPSGWEVFVNLVLERSSVLGNHGSYIFSQQRRILKLSYRTRWPFQGKGIMAYCNTVWETKPDLLLFYIPLLMKFVSKLFQFFFLFFFLLVFFLSWQSVDSSALSALEKYNFCLLCYFLMAGFDKTMDWFYLVNKLFPFICSPGNLLGSWRCIWSQFEIKLSHFYLTWVSMDT